MSTRPAASLRDHLVELRDRTGVPAAGAAIVGPDGLEELDVLGVRRRHGNEPATAADAWHIGSCGKSLTALLWARLVDAGRARWGAPLTELFEDLTAPVAQGWAGVTIDDVLVHRSGLPANPTRADLQRAYRDTAPLAERRTAAATRMLAAPPRHAGRFRYSNVGYVVAGAAVERITGTAFEDALRAHVLGPLGVSSAGFGPPPDLWGHGGRMVALGPLGIVDVGRGGGPADPADPTSDNPPVLSPAGRLHLTLADWARVQQVFLGTAPGGPCITPASLEHLLTPVRGRGPNQAMGWAPARGLGDATLGQQGSNTY
ncbi:MAG: serine hydrolase domain-containing protein [Actinomycetota bacterium]|nr:serine hydrolase domain-containing protein [Actinomycetota bacterium]